MPYYQGYAQRFSDLAQEAENAVRAPGNFAASMRTNRPTWEQGGARQAERVQNGIGGYDTTGFVDPMQQWATADAARRRASETQRLQEEATQRPGRLAFQQAETNRRNQGAPVYGGGAYGAPQYEGSDRARLDQEYGQQQERRATEEANARRQYIQNTLRTWRANPTFAESARQAPGRDSRTAGWNRDALNEFDNERMDEQEQVGQKLANRKKAFEGIALPQYYLDRLEGMSDGDFASLLRAWRPGNAR